MRSHRYENRRLRLVAREVRGNDVLDIGYAQSPNPALARFHTVGYDLARADAPGNAELVQGNAEQIDEVLGGRTFDTIVAGELIEHLERPYDFLRRLPKILAPGGRVVLSTPNPVGFPTAWFELTKSHRRFYERGHTYYFAPRWMERMLDNCDYRLLAMKPVGLWLPFGVVPWCPVTVSYQIIYVAEPAR
jgi:2-polyprenyl-3-methyl-5-hydroxy-6-metoxy-1,4-benzoquinol methylase